MSVSGLRRWVVLAAAASWLARLAVEAVGWRRLAGGQPGADATGGQAGRRAGARLLLSPHCSADSLNAFQVFVLTPSTCGSSLPWSPSQANQDRPSLAC